MGHVVRKEVVKKCDEIAKIIPMNSECIKVVMYGIGVDNIKDILECNPRCLVTKKGKSTALFKGAVDKCYTFDVIIIHSDYDGILVDKGSIPWFNMEYV